MNEKNSLAVLCAVVALGFAAFALYIWWQQGMVEDLDARVSTLEKRIKPTRKATPAPAPAETDGK